MQLWEKYKPKTWSELVGHKQVVRTIQLHQQRGTLGGRAIYISGQSGCGKSSIAWLIASELAEPWNVKIMDAGPLTGHRVLELEDSLATYGMGEKHGRAVIINEVHSLRGEAIRQMLTCFEDGRIKEHCLWVLTTTTDGHKQLFDGIDADPLLSRCLCFQLRATQYLEAFARRVQEIAELEELGGAEFPEYVDLAKRCKVNFRAMLSALEAGEMLSQKSAYR